MTWPLATALDRAVAYPGDPFINTWILDWDWYATLHQPLSLFQGNVFYPAKDSLAFSENLYGIAVFLAPVRRSARRRSAHNLAILLGFAFSGFGAYILGYTVTRSAIAGVVAGIFYAFVPFRFTHLPARAARLERMAAVAARRAHRVRAEAVVAQRVAVRRSVSLQRIEQHSLAALRHLRDRLLDPVAVRDCRSRPPDRCRSDRDRAAHAVSLRIARSRAHGMKRSWHEAKEFSAAPRDWLNPGITNRLYARFADTNVERRALALSGRAVDLLFDRRHDGGAPTIAARWRSP